MSTIRGTLTYHDGDDNENVKKAIDWISKTTTLHVHHAFLYISLPSLHHYDVIIPNFAFYGEPKQPTPKFAFSFWTWILVGTNSAQKEFACIWQSKWSWSNRYRTERTQIHLFLSDVFVAVAVAVVASSTPHYQVKSRKQLIYIFYKYQYTEIERPELHWWIYILWISNPASPFSESTDSPDQKSGCGLHFAKGTHPY